MFDKIFNKLLHEEEEEIVREVKQVKKDIKKSFTKGNILTFIIIFVISLAIRIIFLFYVENPQNAGVGWYGDTYHHWQIAYLTKEIGLGEGFLRLWDLKGMEYFWGLAHPLVTVILMAISGSTNILVVRLLSTFAGVLGICTLFFIVKRYWGIKAAWAACIIAAVNPVLIFNDISGMVEPLGILFLLLALFFWEAKPFLTGIFLGVTSMTRAENWLFAIGLIGAVVLFSKVHADKKIKLVISYLLVIAIYMKYLLDHTGNAIYPIWWNFLGNAAGRWQADTPPRIDQVAIQPVWIAIFVAATLGIIWVIWKKPKGYLFHLLGLANFAFLGAFVGLTEYLKSYETYFWVVRIFDLPYLYFGVLISIMLFTAVPELLKFLDKIKINWLIFLGVIVAMQPAWFIIWRYYKPTAKYWNEEVALAKEVGSYYKDGTVLIHEGDPVMIYTLTRETKIKADNIQGQMYDPFQYPPFSGYSDVFENWGEDRDIIIDWLKKDNIRLLIFNDKRQRYLDLVQKEPDIFKYIKDLPFGLKMYEVKI